MKVFSIIKEVGLRKFISACIKEVYRKAYLGLFLGSYAQNKEDLILEKLLPNKGRYLEIGAYHPTRLSNTYRFYKKGWTGVVVEPNPEVKKIFRKIRPKDTFLNIGVSDKNSFLKYYQYLIPALNTFSSINNGHKIIKVSKIKTKKITDIVKENFDFLSIDTEGFDEMILRSWDWKFKPRVICVEEENLKIKGYRLVAKTKDNSIYCRKPTNTTTKNKPVS